MAGGKKMAMGARRRRWAYDETDIPHDPWRLSYTEC